MCVCILLKYLMTNTQILSLWGPFLFKPLHQVCPGTLHCLRSVIVLTEVEVVPICCPALLSYTHRSIFLFLNFLLSPERLSQKWLLKFQSQPMPLVRVVICTHLKLRNSNLQQWLLQRNPPSTLPSTVSPR